MTATMAMLDSVQHYLLTRGTSITLPWRDQQLAAHCQLWSVKQRQLYEKTPPLRIVMQHFELLALKQMQTSMQ